MGDGRWGQYKRRDASCGWSYPWLMKFDSFQQFTILYLVLESFRFHFNSDSMHRQLWIAFQSSLQMFYRGTSVMLKLQLFWNENTWKIRYQEAFNCSLKKLAKGCVGKKTGDSSNFNCSLISLFFICYTWLRVALGFDMIVRMSDKIVLNSVPY